MDEKWGRGDLVKLLFVKKAKYELNTDGWVGLQQMEKMGEEIQLYLKLRREIRTGEEFGDHAHGGAIIEAIALD